jgi:hypothetical protein
MRREDINYSELKSSKASISESSKLILNGNNKTTFLENNPNHLSIYSQKANDYSEIISNLKMKENNSKVTVLEKKLEQYKQKYARIIKVIKDHEDKFEKLVAIINSKKEIKAVLAKYGIQIK